MTGDWWFLTALWALSAVAIAYGARRVSPARLGRWQARFDVELDGATSPLVGRRLRAGGAVRWTAFAIGMNVTMLPMYMNVIEPSRAADFNTPAVTNAFFFATAAGAFVFEVCVRQRNVDRSSNLVRRRSADYIDPRWPRIVAGLALATLVITVVASVQRTDEWATAWVGVAAALIALAASTIGINAIVNRPSLASSGPFRVADDALRADGAHHLLGAVCALATVGLSTSGQVLLPHFPWALLLGLLPWLGIAWWSRLWSAEPWSVRAARRAPS
jgi:hypothetical protein